MVELGDLNTRTPPAPRRQPPRNVGGTAMCSANHVDIQVTTGAATLPTSLLTHGLHASNTTLYLLRHPMHVAKPPLERIASKNRGCAGFQIDHVDCIASFIDLMRASCADLHAQRKAYLSDCRTLAPSITQQLNQPRARSAYLGVGLSYARVNPIVIAQGSNGARGRLLFR